MPLINVLLWVSLLLLAGLTYLLVSAYNRAEEQAALQLAGLSRRYPGLAPTARQSTRPLPGDTNCSVSSVSENPSRMSPPLLRRSGSNPVSFFEIADRPKTDVPPSFPEYELPRAAGGDKREETKEMAVAIDCHYCA